MRYVVVTFEGAFGIGETDIGSAIQDSLEGIRGGGSGRAVDFKILETDKEYEDWYNSPKRIHEVIVPSPTTITFD